VGATHVLQAQIVLVPAVRLLGELGRLVRHEATLDQHGRNVFWLVSTYEHAIDRAGGFAIELFRSRCGLSVGRHPPRIALPRRNEVAHLDHGPQSLRAAWRSGVCDQAQLLRACRYMRLQLDVVGDRFPGFVYAQAPRNVYWEMTIACGLACQHCRASAIDCRDPGELTTDEAKKLMADVREMGSMLVLTGGDPLERPDVFELLAYAKDIGLRVAITPAVTPKLDRGIMQRLASLGVAAVGVSLDGPNAELHDGFRNVPGTFARSMDALRWAREFELPVQVNTTVTAHTLPHLQAMYELLRDEASPPVKRWSLFMLVPMGRGNQLATPTAAEVEEMFAWVYGISKQAPFRVGTTEAPHYRRFWIQRQLAEGVEPEAVNARGRAMAFGIRDGNGVVFVSHRGEVYPAGFLPHPLVGNVRDKSIAELYRSEPLQRLRDPDNLTARCGRCDFKYACGGSRARAFSMTGDAFGEDPLCAHEPD
jgi:AdoMet-dependent heme synthase